MPLDPRTARRVCSATAPPTPAGSDRLQVGDGLPAQRKGRWLVRHGRYVTFQMAKVAIPRDLFADILRRIDRLGPPPAPARATTPRSYASPSTRSVRRDRRQKNAIPRHQRRQLVLNHPDQREDGRHSKANCTSSGFESHSTAWEGSIWGNPGDHRPESTTWRDSASIDTALQEARLCRT